MLREHLEYHWRSHVLPVLTLVFLYALTFASIAMVNYGERAVGLSARLSTPPSDFIIYIEAGNAQDFATALDQNPNVDTVHVDAWRAAEAISFTGNVSMVLRSLPPEDLRTQALARGEYPTDPSHIAVTYQLAEALGVDIGSYLTIAGDLVAERYLITGIYARSPFDDRLDSAFEGLVLDAFPNYVAAYVDDSGQGGIEVKGTSARATQEIMDDVLAVGNSVVLRSQDRHELILDRHARAASAITATVPWLLLTGFLVGTTVLMLGLAAGIQHRVVEQRNLRVLGVKRQTLLRMHVSELVVITVLSAAIGLGLGLAISHGIVVFYRSVPGAQFMPSNLGAPLSAYALAAAAVLGAVVIAAPLARAIASAEGRVERRARTILLVPLSVVTGAVAIYWAGLLAHNLSGPPPAASQLRAVALIALLVIVAFVLSIALLVALTRRLKLGARTHLLPRSRVGLVRLLTLLVIFLGAAALGTIHTTTESLAGEDMPFQDRFDVSVRSRLGKFELTDHQINAVRSWDAADRTLSLRLIETDLPADASFQPGPIYAVEPTEAESYFGASLDFNSRLLVPRGTPNIPETVSFVYYDPDRIVHVVHLAVAEANVPVAMVSIDDAPGLKIDEIWVRLVPNALETLSQTYPDFEERLGSDTPYTRPVITLSLTEDAPRPLNTGHLAMVIESSIFIVLAFMTFTRVPRAFSLYESENRNLRALGLSDRRRQFRRLGDASISGVMMLIGGSLAGIAASWIIQSDEAMMGMPLQVPWTVLLGNMAIILLACMTFESIRARADVAHDTNSVF